MTGRSARGYSSLYDQSDRRENKQNAGNTLLLQSGHDKKLMEEMWLTRFLRNLSILKDLLVRDGRVEGIASAKFKGSGAAAEASGFGIDLLSIDININFDINININININIDINININIDLLCNNIDVLNMFSTANLTSLLSILLVTLMQLCSALSDKKFPASSGWTPPPCSCGEAFSSDGKKKWQSLSKMLQKFCSCGEAFLSDGETEEITFQKCYSINIIFERQQVR